MATCTPPAQTCAYRHNSSVGSTVLVCRSRNFGNLDAVSCEFIGRLCVSTCVGRGSSAVDIGGVGGWASGSAWYLAKLWDLPFSPFITNFARNSVVRQIDNGAKTAEFQRCEFKVGRSSEGITCEIEVGDWCSPRLSDFVGAIAIKSFGRQNFARRGPRA